MAQKIVANDYTIHFGSIAQLSCIDFNSYSKVIFLLDDEVNKHCWPILEKKKLVDKNTLKVVVPHGEENKNLSTCSFIFKQFISLGIDRKSLVVNLGGGVIGDMGGYCASVFLRGIPFIQIPTTLLAMVDASVGGKVAVNFDDLKNMIGLFQNPIAVFIDSIFLETLPKRHIKSGYVEVLKHGLISSQNLWDDLKNKNPHSITEDIIYNAVEVKHDIVKKDFKESHLRKVLNLGHTAGHALEHLALKNNTDIYHGEAVAFGLIFAAYLSHKHTGLSSEERDDIIAYAMPFIPKNIMKIEAKQFIDGMKSDKKNAQDEIRMVLLKAIGHPVVNHVVDENDLYEALQWTVSCIQIDQKN